MNTTILPFKDEIYILREKLKLQASIILCRSNYGSKFSEIIFMSPSPKGSINFFLLVLAKDLFIESIFILFSTEKEDNLLDRFRTNI